MAAKSSKPSKTEQRMSAIHDAWKTLRPAKTFAGMTLAEFEARIKPSQDTRTELAALNDQVDAAILRRDKADDETDRLVKLVVNSVKGDVDEGTDGELYKAMGYVPDSERDSGLTRGGSTTPPTSTP